jgi:hypothetical protein
MDEERKKEREKKREKGEKKKKEKIKCHKMFREKRTKGFCN